MSAEIERVEEPKVIEITWDNDLFIRFTYDTYAPEGEWDAPFPNTKEDSYVYGLLESWGQSDVYSALFALADDAEVVHVKIRER